MAWAVHVIWPQPPIPDAGTTAAPKTRKTGMGRGAAIAFAVAGVALASCAKPPPGEFAGRTLSPVRQNYIEPTVASVTQTAILDRAQTDVWDAVARRLQEKGLIVEHRDPDAGEMAARYSGEPEPYVDCGTLVHEIAGRRGRPVNRLPAARDNLQYDLALDYKSVWVFRKIWLDGWMIVRVGPGGATTTTGDANIRAEPNTEAEILTTLPAGTAVTILGPSGEKGWYRVEAAGRATAYIADFLVTEPDSTAVTAQTTYVVTRTMSIGSGEDVERTREVISFVTGGSASFSGGTRCLAKGTMEQLALQP
ncbi:MAG: SH3 domain-containing protein [Kiloniellales bacterium]